jgi:hypothetical protein
MANGIEAAFDDLLPELRITQPLGKLVENERSSLLKFWAIVDLR